MKIGQALTRQIIELLKLYLIGLIAPSVLITGQLASAANPVDLILQGLNMPFFMLYVIVFTYPFTALWFLWLACAHYFAVRKKYFGLSVFGSSKALNLLINRPLILSSGVLVLAVATVGAPSSYPITFHAVLAFSYSLYLLVSSLATKRANA